MVTLFTYLTRYDKIYASKKSVTLYFHLKFQTCLPLTKQNAILKAHVSKIVRRFGIVGLVGRYRKASFSDELGKPKESAFNELGILLRGAWTIQFQEVSTCHPPSNNL